MAIDRLFSWPRRILAVSLLGLGGALAAIPVIAQATNFAGFSLSVDSPTATVTGFTTGFLPLSNIAGRDRRGLVCAGFADTNPDHTMTLQQDFPNLTVQVNSGGNDTALLIQGPSNDTIRCGTDTDRRNPDAQVQDSDWRAGTYQIWVGSHNQGQRYDYSLQVSP
ncbi:MAG: hypothetical protein HC922_02475 [Leptolyngbyaceae cyanobacterium SM2_3_12]|nr:hypothetical protein [Leptolyngbyaceae cyanobacterium SM2_3_12]